MNLNQFLSSSLTNAWIKEPYLQLYIRKSTRLYNKQIYQCLDLANILVQTNYRGKGIFTKFLTRFEPLAFSLNKTIFVESILNYNLKNFFLKSGYILDPQSSDFSPCVFKFKEQTNVKN